ncbi:hypothetical protein [Pseudomonas luteola]|uniref:hypothetical protein n=1 Tax=Pseudomonas luteola TaxID=47886 RepID=UPI00091B469D|nr:hypothetical protein [Pseudomonas zeshuii]SHJ68863.1 hypothetical protein SAMN05216295_12260 [Pseudomonas zeshuii]
MITILVFGFISLLCIGLAAKIIKWIWLTIKWILILNLVLITLPVTVPYLTLKGVKNNFKNRKFLNKLKSKIESHNFFDAFNIIEAHNPKDLDKTLKIIEKAKINLVEFKEHIKLQYLQSIDEAINSQLDLLKGNNFMELSSLSESLQPIYKKYCLGEEHIFKPEKILADKVRNQELEVETPRTQGEEKSVTLIRRYVVEDISKIAIEI